MTDRFERAAYGVAVNPSAPSSVLLRLLAKDDPYLRRAIMGRENLPRDVADVIVAHPDRRVRMDFAESWTADPEQRARLVDDPDPRVILAVAIGPNPYRTPVPPLPDWAYERLLGHPDANVRHETVMSPPVAVHTLIGFADHEDPFFRRTACRRVWHELPDSVRQLLLHDKDTDVRRAASFQVCHEDEERTTELVDELPEAGSWRLMDILKRGRLSRAVAERMMAQPRFTSDLAHNPSLPADLVAKLAAHPDPHVRLAVSARPELTEEERAAIDYVVEPEARLETLDWVRDARDDVDVLRRCATSAHIWLRRSAAVCRGMTPDLVELLARDEDFAVRLLLAEFHPEPPPELLLDLYLHGTQHRAVFGLIVKLPFPSSGLAARFADSDDPRCRDLVARDPGAAPELIERLSRDPAPSVRCAAARDPRLSLARVRELLAEPETASAAAMNRDLPFEDMHAVLDGAGIPA
ncbi:hypothetical protein [Streptomyces sp. NPDC005408]|uniref:hypothetical protein n=1 Tax=Streptomyces sp. NPDC005408 TaxID=3155341 RepID=UPI0033B268CF